MQFILFSSSHRRSRRSSERGRCRRLGVACSLSCSFSLFPALLCPLPGSSNSDGDSNNSFILLIDRTIVRHSVSLLDDDVNAHWVQQQRQFQGHSELDANRKLQKLRFSSKTRQGATKVNIASATTKAGFSSVQMVWWWAKSKHWLLHNHCLAVFSHQFSCRSNRLSTLIFSLVFPVFVAFTSTNSGDAGQPAI